MDLDLDARTAGTRDRGPSNSLEHIEVQLNRFASQFNRLFFTSFRKGLPRQ